MTAPIRSAIPTTYRGTNFRSRLEARWAAFFDLVGWRWTYEPIDAGGYIPDFLIHGASPLFVEVGPCVSRDEFITKSTKANARAAHLTHDLIVLGVSPVPERYNQDEHPMAGLLGEFYPADRESEYKPDHLASFWWDEGRWGQCYQCGSIGVVHIGGSFHLRPCGHYQSGSWGKAVNALFLDTIWRRAGNDTQWQPESVGSIMRRLGR